MDNMKEIRNDAKRIILEAKGVGIILLKNMTFIVLIVE
jgi:hypothetical protein